MELKHLFLFFIFPTSTYLYIVKEVEVNFYLHTRNSAELQITENNFHSINASKIFHFIIHGWIANHEIHWVQNMTDAYLEQSDCNVIQIDWRVPAAQPVYVSANNTKGVGTFVGKFISKLIKELGVKPTNINLVGHSFGSHVSGFAGKQVFKETGVKVGKITVTDPARRPFESSVISDNDRLTNADATTVVGIHSDAGVKGFLNPIGTIDFYPNGGLDPQPGCEGSEDTPIRNPVGFTAVKCDSYENYTEGICKNDDRVNLGGNVEDFEGVFYFQTNPEPPYSKN